MLGLPRGHLPARLTVRPDRSSPPAGHSAVRPSCEPLAEGVPPPITASGGVRVEHELRYLDCQRLTAVRAPSNRFRFQRTQAYSQNRCSLSPRTVTSHQ